MNQIKEEHYPGKKELIDITINSFQCSSMMIGKFIEKATDTKEVMKLDSYSF